MKQPNLATLVAKPNTLAIDLKSVREPAQALLYVMMSRIQALDQPFILNEFPECKMYPSDAAMTELTRLQEVALNGRQIVIKNSLLLPSLNIGSLPRHHRHLLSDPQIGGDVIALQETWCDTDEDHPDLNIPGYEMKLVSHGRG